MNIFEIIISSFALASDAFAVSISKGLSINKIRFKDCCIIGLWFGFFQFLMPLLGYLFGNYFENVISNIDHFIAFFILCYIGGKMVYDSFNKYEVVHDSLSISEMFMFAIATSIDAFTFGIAYSFVYKKNSGLCFIIIGLITFILSFLGVKLGSRLGCKYEKLTKIIGGVILIILGFNVLIDHLF